MMRRFLIPILGHIVAAPITLLSIVTRPAVLSELAMLCAAGCLTVACWLIVVVLLAPGPL